MFLKAGRIEECAVKIKEIPDKRGRIRKRNVEIS
jgi:hypothetical protein